MNIPQMKTSVTEVTTTVLKSRPVELTVELSRSPMFFAFPEMIVNPTTKPWYPWVCLFIRLWVYQLVWHHVAELKSLMDFIPLAKLFTGG